ncbi:type 2 periplasmic-binding domain-containing protein [Arthrobacter pigmenti]
MWRRVPRLLLASLAVLALVLTGCSPDNNQDDGNDAPQGSQLQKVLDRGTLRVAVLPDFPPWSVQTAGGGFEGYEVDLAKELADAMGVKLKLVSTDGTSRLPLLESDRVDVNISAWTATNDRAKSVGFTIPYAAAGASVLFQKGTNIQSYEDLAGLRVAVARGSTNDTIMTQRFPDTEVVRFETIADAIQALKSGKVDATVEGEATVAKQAEENANLQQIDAPPLNPSPISMGVLPTDQDWINYLDNFIRNINISGRNAELYEKWFSSEFPDVIG